MNTPHHTKLIEDMAASVRATKPLPPMSVDSEQEAYNIQKLLVQAVDANGPHDLKAGVTSLAMQQYLGLSAPLLGSLYGSNKLNNHCKLSPKEGQELECEIGVVVDSTGNPIGMLPIIEVIYLSFSREQDLTLPNLIAANLGANSYICGDIVPWNPAIEQVSIDVYIDEHRQTTLTNDYSYGTPESGAAWMIEEATKLGLFTPGQPSGCLLSLGTCGAPLKGQSGKYRMDFGPLGEVRFEIG